MALEAWPGQLTDLLIRIGFCASCRTGAHRSTSRAVELVDALLCVSRPVESVLPACRPISDAAASELFEFGTLLPPVSSKNRTGYATHKLW